MAEALRRKKRTGLGEILREEAAYSFRTFFLPISAFVSAVTTAVDKANSEVERVTPSRGKEQKDRGKSPATG